MAMRTDASTSGFNLSTRRKISRACWYFWELRVILSEWQKLTVLITSRFNGGHCKRKRERERWWAKSERTKRERGVRKSTKLRHRPHPVTREKMAVHSYFQCQQRCLADICALWKESGRGRATWIRTCHIPLYTTTQRTSWRCQSDLFAPIATLCSKFDWLCWIFDHELRCMTIYSHPIMVSDKKQRMTASKGTKGRRRPELAYVAARLLSTRTKVGLSLSLLNVSDRKRNLAKDETKSTDNYQLQTSAKDSRQLKSFQFGSKQAEMNEEEEQTRKEGWKRAHSGIKPDLNWCRLCLQYRTEFLWILRKLIVRDLESLCASINRDEERHHFWWDMCTTRETERGFANEKKESAGRRRRNLGGSSQRAETERNLTSDHHPPTHSSVEDADSLLFPNLRDRWR